MNPSNQQSQVDTSSGDTWYDGDEENSYDNESYKIAEYDITTSPNDFNIKTIYDFMESGAIKIPAFQRNYVWDIKRASKLIESIIMGLPIPQVFLYEESRNSFLVIDGQQRLMSIYYFMKQRFPRTDKRNKLRQIFEENGKIPDQTLNDDELFTKFNLRLPEKPPDQLNKLNKKTYSTLDDYKFAFDLRTIRNIIIKQNFPENDDSCIYEIFNRLNSGGVNLKPQEIRTSLYHSDFYTMLARLNSLPTWRSILGVDEPDLHMKDIEVLLRGFAILLEQESYRSPMVKFLNDFSRKCKKFEQNKIEYLEELFKSFLKTCENLPGKDFYLKTTNKFNMSMFEAVFFAQCENAYKQHQLVEKKIDPLKLEILKSDSLFLEAIQSQTISKNNVTKKLERAMIILGENT